LLPDSTVTVSLRNQGVVPRRSRSLQRRPVCVAALGEAEVAEGDDPLVGADAMGTVADWPKLGLVPAAVRAML
jgi:hypothetical protein